MKKLFIFILVVVSITTVGAQDKYSKQFTCESIYNLSSNVAEQRQAGISPDNLRDMAGKLDSKTDGFAKDYLTGMTNLAYSIPVENISRLDFANYFFMSCIIDLKLDQEIYGG